MTVLWYKELLAAFYRWLGFQGLPTNLGAMSEELVELFILELQERPGLKGPEMSTHSVANRVIDLNTFFGWLVQKRYTNGHLLEDIKHPKKAQLIIETLTLAEREGRFWRSQIHLSMKDGVFSYDTYPYRPSSIPLE